MARLSLMLHRTNKIGPEQMPVGKAVRWTETGII